MKIIADQDIPYIKEYFAKEDCLFKPGRSIQAADLSRADALIVRSVTKVDENLLRQTPIKFVGTVTAGVDHLDIQYLEQANIQWAAASGHNAPPVADYVICVLAALQQQGKLAKNNLRIGVVGVGHVGSLVAKRLQILGYEVLCCDPLRAEQENDFHSYDLSELQNVDVLTLHAPLTESGKYPTRYMLKESAAKVIINTCRGAIISPACYASSPALFCLDVWENEPQIDLALLERATIATPHLAGYAIESKRRGIEMIYRSMCAKGWLTVTELSWPAPIGLKLTFKQEKNQTWQDIVLNIFDPFTITTHMQNALLRRSLNFDQLRQQYIGPDITRHEFGYTAVSQVQLSAMDNHILKQFGIHFSENNT